MNRIEKIYNDLCHNKNTIITYKGVMTKEKIEELLRQIENKTQKISKKTQKKIFFISVELLQNMYHHTVENTENKMLKICIFNISINPQKEQIEFSCGNFVDKNNKQIVENKIDTLNSISETELRKLYKQVLNNNKFSEKGGGGLGLIDIKRKSLLPFEYNYTKFQKNFYFFNFFVFLDNKKIKHEQS